MTSVYLKFFETAADGKTRRCKFCGQTYSIATATGNLGRHLANRHPGYDKSGDAASNTTTQHTAVVKKTQPQGKANQVDDDSLNWLLIRWLVTASLPLSTLEEKWLIFYMSVTCQWIDENWCFQKVLLDICRIPSPYGSTEIYHSLIKVLKMYNIENRVLSFTHDNSQSATHACHTLKEDFDAQKVGPFCYLPCAARTLSLIIGDGLRSTKSMISKIREFVIELNVSSEMAEDFFKCLWLIKKVLRNFHVMFPQDGVGITRCLTSFAREVNLWMQLFLNTRRLLVVGCC